MNLPENVEKFINNCNRLNIHPHSGDVYFNNIYHIEKFDINGNRIDEKFGTNFITDLGFDNIKWSGNVYAVVLDFGNSETLSPSTKRLEGQLVYASLGNTYNLKIDTIDPFVYDSNTGFITTYIPLTATLDYDVMSGSHTLNCLGLRRGTGTDEKCLTKSFIYDENGTRSSIVKNEHEKINVTIYIGVSMNMTNAVTSNWSNGTALMINPLIIFTGVSGMGSISSVINQRLAARLNWSIKGGTSDAGYNRTYDMFKHKNVDPEFTYARGIIQYSQQENDLQTIEQGWISKYVIYSESNTFVQVTTFDNVLSTPEVITLEGLMTNHDDPTFTDTVFSISASSGSFPYKTDYRSRFPLNKMNVSSIKVYDYVEHDWVTITFSQDASYIYDDSFDRHMLYRATVNNVTKVYHVFTNNKATQFTINHFETNGIRVYATDTYWDISSWDLLSLNNISQSQGNKRFYIVEEGNNSNMVELVPYYDYTTLQLTNVSNSYTIPNEGIPYYDHDTPIIPNNNCNCIIGLNKIIYPDDPNNVVSYAITGYDNIEMKPYESGNYYDTTNLGVNYAGFSIFRLTENGDRLVCAHRRQSDTNTNDNYAAGCYRIYTISSNKTVAPSYKDIQVPYTNTSFDVQTYHSFSDQGYVVACHNDDNEICIIDLYANVGNEFTMLTGTWGYALNGTTKMVYRDMNDLSVIKMNIYDMDTKQQLGTFTLEGGYLMNGIMGWKDHVYIRVLNPSSERYEIFYYSITNDQLVIVDLDINDTTERCCMNEQPFGSFDNSWSSCDECFVYPIYTAGGSFHNRWYSFRILLDSDPTHPISINERKRFPDETSVGGAKCGTHGRIMKNTDGSFLALEVYLRQYNPDGAGYTYIESKYPYSDPLFDASFNSSSSLLDLGDLIDNNNVDSIIITNNPHNISNGAEYVTDVTYTCFNTIYKSYDVGFTNSTITFRPLIHSRLLRLTGTTTCIQTINNPKQIGVHNVLSFGVSR